MRSLVPKLLGASIALLALVWVPAASAAPAVTGKFELATELGDNNKIVAGPDGNMWFTLQGKKVGEISPAGLVKEFELTGIENTIGIAAGPEGRIWVVATGKAVSFLPSNPTGTQVKFESALINGEPNIVLGPEGLFWVASSGKVAKFSPANFNGITEVPVTIPLGKEFKPKDIAVAGSLIVISDTESFGVLETSRVVTFTSAGVETDFTIPGGSQGLAGSPTGQIAYSAAAAKPEQAGLITPPGPASAFELVGDPFGVVYGSDQAFWIVDFAKGGLTRLTSTGMNTFLPGLPVETARQVGAGPNNTLWVTLVHKEKVVEVSAIARVSGLEPPVVVPPPAPVTPILVTTKPVPNTKIGKGPKPVIKVVKGKATVKFSFSSTVAGSSFQCRLFKVPTGKGKKRKPHGAFSSCRSPKVLHVAPGKYRFGVRAVAAGVTDGSAAERPFTVVRVRPHR